MRDIPAAALLNNENYGYLSQWPSAKPVSLCEAPPLVFEYINYKGVQEVRRVTSPVNVFKASEYHNNGEPTWLLVAYDLDRKAEREFHMKDILRFI